MIVSRRQMRIRVMQALYAWHTGAGDATECYDLNLKESIDEIRERENAKGDRGDSKMMDDLFYETVKRGPDLGLLIEKKAANWELERIALIDKILMQMALVEFLVFPEVPPKVSINEYIDIAKKFSTPKSSTFINGILDGLLIDLRTSGEVVKTGRGLMDETAPEKKKIKRPEGYEPPVEKKTFAKKTFVKKTPAQAFEELPQKPREGGRPRIQKPFPRLNKPVENPNEETPNDNSEKDDNYYNRE